MNVEASALRRLMPSGQRCVPLPSFVEGKRRGVFGGSAFDRQMALQHTLPIVFGRPLTAGEVDNITKKLDVGGYISQGLIVWVPQTQKHLWIGDSGQAGLEQLVILDLTATAKEYPGTIKQVVLKVVDMSENGARVEIKGTKLTVYNENRRPAVIDLAMI